MSGKPEKRPKQRVNWPSARASQIRGALAKLGFEHYKTRGSHTYHRLPGGGEYDVIQVPGHASEEHSHVAVKRFWKRANEYAGVTEKEFLDALSASK